MKPQAWVIYWGGADYLADPLTPGKVYLWTGHRDGRKGDTALLYATRPVSALVAQLELTTDGRFSNWAGRFQAHPYSFKVRLIRTFRAPISLKLLRLDPVLSQWGLVRGSFQMPFGKPPRVPPELLKRILKKAR
jgi:hypothetical protein